jgi:excisionase family DNA binding protein
LPESFLLIIIHIMREQIDAGLTLDEVASILRCSKSKVRTERLAGRLRAFKLGRLVRVSRKELQRYLRNAEKGERTGEAGVHREVGDR